MLADWERAYPGRTESIFSALRHVEVEHLADPRRFDFASLDDKRAPSPFAAAIEPMSMVDEDAMLERA
jgi:hypothetical protein